jgi:Branched-chain amino acid transport protein (AzlD).
MTWLSIVIAGILTYFTRMTMIALVSRDMLGDRIKSVLAYVPSASISCNNISGDFY